MEMYIGLGIIGLFIVACIVVVLQGKKRTKELKSLAETMNFSFLDEYADEDHPLFKPLKQLNLFRMSRRQSATNVMQGTVHDVAVTIMDHSYSTGSGKNAKHYYQTVIVFQSDLLRLPTFTLRHEGLAHSFSENVLGYRDMDFDTHPAFSKRYHLHGHDEESIRKIFDGDVLAYFEEHDKLIADGHGDRLMLCRPRKTVAVKDIGAFLEQGFEVFRLFEATYE